MTGIALLMALVVVLQFVSSMIPPVGGFSISLVLIPIVMGAAIFGPSAGALLGGVFGAVVYINCVTSADPGGAMVFQANPVLCFLVVMGKGILAGLLAGVVYAALKKWNPHVAILCAAPVHSVWSAGWMSSSWQKYAGKVILCSAHCPGLRALRASAVWA